MKYSVAEFFSGCGGFSRGFLNSGRFNVALGNDIKPEALQTFKFNNCLDGIQPQTILQDIRNVPLNLIVNKLRDGGVQPGELDCLIGGPPCQGFSQLRRSEERENGKIVKFRGYSKIAHDPRNDLVLRYLEIAEHLRPKFIVIENVPQMLNHGRDGRLGHLSEIIVAMLEKDLGYSVEVAVLTAANYGVPQLRDRAIFIASAIGAAPLPPPTHAAPEKCGGTGTQLLPWITVGDAIKNLPPPSETNDNLAGKNIKVYLKKGSAYEQLMKTSATFPFNHVTRPYKNSVLNIIKEMRPGQTWVTESQRIRQQYSTMINTIMVERNLTAESAREFLEKTGTINPVFFKDYYWSAYTRLAWDEPALTITANANFLGSGRFTHPESMRGITMREAARLQSFDDNFRFITSADDNENTTRISIGMDMIGEAVPPLMAQAIAMAIAAKLDARKSQYAYGKQEIVHAHQ